MAVEEEEVDDVPHDGRGLETLLLRAIDDKVSPEPSRFLDVREGRIESRRPVERDVRERSGSFRAGAVVVLPLVDVVSGVSNARYFMLLPLDLPAYSVRFEHPPSAGTTLTSHRPRARRRG